MWLTSISDVCGASLRTASPPGAGNGLGHGLSIAGRQIDVTGTFHFFLFVAAATLLAALTVLGLWLVTERTMDAALNESAREAVDVDLAGLADIIPAAGKRIWYGGSTIAWHYGPPTGERRTTYLCAQTGSASPVIWKPGRISMRRSRSGA